MKQGFMAGLAVIAGLAVTGCTNTIKYDNAPIANQSTVQQVGLEQFEKSTDSMLASMLDDADVQAVSHAKRPMLAVYGMTDITSENIDTAALNSRIMTALDKSSRFRFVKDADLSKAVSNLNPNPYDLEEQPDAAKPLTSAVDADYLLIGQISRIIRAQPNVRDVFYRVTLKLVDPRNNKFVWQEQREFLKSEEKTIYGI